MSIIRTSLAATALAAALALTAAPTPGLAQQTQAEALAEIDGSIGWIDYLLRRADDGDLIIELNEEGEAGGQGADIETRFVPLNRDAIINAARRAVADGEMTSGDAAMVVVLWGRQSGRKLNMLRQMRADLVKRRAEALRHGAVQPWELGRPPADYTPPVRAAEPGGYADCTAEGVWANSVTGLASSTWTIDADGKASESGMGGVRGQAGLSGSTLTIEWDGGAYAGVYEIDLDPGCATGQGAMTWTRAPGGGKTFPARFRKLSGPTARGYEVEEGPNVGGTRKQ